MKQVGKHLILELWGITKINALNDEDKLRNIVEKAVEATNTKMLSLHSHKFEPHGYSVLAILEESHISIHTWPELRYVAIDVFTCGNDAVPENAIDVFTVMLEAKHKKILMIDRGIPT